ncbi:MAG: flagellar basal body L-ring protein FlgH [Gemmatimonadota bacterium]|nr:flagellar basal body L-ring protein FlgH [Gemmatimonadota bacterium]MDH5758216.1 flagellar basal body L-ring protein FlgH [Gemmatimonadota bacterium]
MKGRVLKRVIVSISLLAVLPSVGRAQAQEQAPPPPPPSGPPVRTSWTSDRVDLRTGDVVTILIDELTLASADRNDSKARDRDRAVSVGFGTAGGNLRSSNDVSDRSRGEASRRERFSAELSVRVVEVLPSGVVRLEGTKRVRIDDHEQEVTVRGWVRAQDVSTANTVESWRVADAEIQYGSNGELTKSRGIWSKILDLIIP